MHFLNSQQPSPLQKKNQICEASIRGYVYAGCAVCPRKGRSRAPRNSSLFKSPLPTFESQSYMFSAGFLSLTTCSKNLTLFDSLPTTVIYFPDRQYCRLFCGGFLFFAQDKGACLCNLHRQTSFAILRVGGGLSIFF